MTSPSARVFAICVSTVWFWCCSHAQAADDPLFPQVRAILESKCLSCHNAHDKAGDFSLETAAGLMDSGYVEPGDAPSSHLLQVVQSQGDSPPAMPQDASPLSADQISVLRRWISDGANWPAGQRLQEAVVDDFNWWSFQPLHPVTPPPVSPHESHLVQTPVDLFILKALRARGLKHSAPADRRVLIRRLTYDLTGLPPTPEQVRSFVESKDPDAYERLVDRLLTSPRYGERWARHWLDVVKYADTCGYDKDKLRPHAWPYRDYVVRSFNQDKPYTQFVREQIAGDVLYPDQPDGILGLGFIAAGPWDFIGHVEVPESKLDGQVARHLDRDEMVSNTLNTFCSITIQCARCHNHKFDPFTQQHYYNLQSVFAAVDRAERVYASDSQTESRRDALLARQTQIDKQLQALQQTIDREGGSQLRKLDAEIASLKPKLELAKKPDEFGFHSQIADRGDVEKWVEVQLDRPADVAEVILRPCHDDYNDIGAGFGFPVRFRIEGFPDHRANTSQNTAGATGLTPDEMPALLADFTQRAFPNPGLTDVRVKGIARRLGRIRVVATQLARRKDDFNFALAEIEVRDTAGRNIATGCSVVASDSIEAPARWQKKNLTDGLYPVAADPAAWRKYYETWQQRQQILDRIQTPDRQKQQQTLQQQRAAVKKQLDALPAGKVVYAAATHFRSQGNFKPTEGRPRAVHVLHRGNIDQPKQPAVPGTVPLAAGDDPVFPLPEVHAEGERRAALARWITDPQNPLTWRSIANRIWQYHFGVGLVESPNDFGRMGQLPSHPELLDWLALEFRRTQSFKHLHRQIVLSSTYQQASAHHPQNAAIDANNRFLWRMNRRRLSAEELRDSILAVSGRLNLTMGGPGFYLFELEKPEHSPHFQYHKFDPNNEASHRRSVYRFVVRSQPDPFLTTLDCADSSQSTPRRTETITALQALSLLNNRFNLTMARHFADDLQSVDAPVAAAFERVTGRAPTPAENQRLSDYARQHGLTSLCRVLFNLNEFVFVD